MDLTKKKYKKDEVVDLINHLEKASEQKINDYKFRIAELIKENEKLSAEILSYKNREESISSAIKIAQDKAREIEETANAKYTLEVEKIAVFRERYKKYFEYLCEKYPFYPALEKIKIFYGSLNKILSNDKDKDAFDTVAKEFDNVDNASAFNPKAKIKEYIVATEDNGFNLNDVLNPGELHLEDICKELGLMEDEKQ